MKDKKEGIDKQIQSIEITDKHVKIGFKIATLLSPGDGEGESPVAVTEYSTKSQHRASKSFIKCFTDMAEDGLEISEMNVSGSKKDYTVCKVKIDGDLFMNKSRVTLTVAKLVERTGDVIKFDTPQVTLSSESKYLEWKSLQKKVIALIKEAWKYLAGENMDSTQLAFSFDTTTIDIPESKFKKEDKKEKEKPEKETKSKVRKMDPTVVTDIPLATGAQA